MRIIITLALAFLGFGCMDQKVSDQADHDEIMSVMQFQQDAWNENDIDVFMEGYWQSDSLKFIGATGVTYGWQTTLENYKKRYPDADAMGVLKFDIISLEKLSGEYYHMLGKYTLQRKEDTPSGHFTLLWKKIDGKWKIIVDQTC